MNFGKLSPDLPVTVDVLQKVKPGCEAEFELVLTDLMVAAESFEGHLGVNVFRPVDRINPAHIHGITTLFPGRDSHDERCNPTPAREYLDRGGQRDECRYWHNKDDLQA